jgi:CHAD domain-containing protein/CYTH domain-containing protein
MILPAELPGLPAEEAARLLALEHLEAARAARTGLWNPAEPEALHDYRVALRRLRSCLRGYARELRGTVSGKTLRGLRRLADATRASRDLEVHRAWLEEQAELLDPVERAGVEWLVRRLEAAARDEREKMLAADARRFERLHRRLRAELGTVRLTIRLDGSRRRRTMATVAGRQIGKAALRLRRRLTRVHGYPDVLVIHRARIAAKHLRYLLEPWALLVPDAPEILDRLKGLQDAFGDIHDAHVFAAELSDLLLEAWQQGAAAAPTTNEPPATPVPGLRALAGLLHRRGRAAFDRARTDWLGSGAEPFFRRVEEAAAAIADLGGGDLEIERKFLLTGMPPLEAAAGTVEIEQGYLPGERLVERIRRIVSTDGERFTRAFKQGSGIARLAIEESLTPEDFARLWPLTEGRRVRKRRHRVADGALTWEIDEFLDRDLVLAGVALGDPSAALEVPAWLAPWVRREVTDDPGYHSFRLAAGLEPQNLSRDAAGVH